MAQPDYGDAGKRHALDAGLLLKAARYDGASHLAGLAAECGLKALVGASLTPSPTGHGPPTLAGQKAGHLPDLWGTAMSNLRTRHRPDSAVAGLISRDSNPFADWEMETRYARSNSVNKQAAERHLLAARAVVAAL